ncbi:unnamed protein product, partial [Mesorhabditis spiculigera]
MPIISTSVVLLDLVAYLAVAGAENPICIAENEKILFVRRRLNCPVIRTHKKCDEILYGDYRAKTCDDFAPHAECLFAAQMSACDNSTEFKVHAYKHKLLELASLETRKCRGEYIKAFKDAIDKIESGTDSSA